MTSAPGAPRLTAQDEIFVRAIADQLVGAIHRAELFAQIEALAYTDSLTGLASRRAVETALEEACGAPAGPGSPALVLCDIDDLKQVNDRGGHAAGDRALRRAAEALVGAAAPHEDAVVGRFGGDEFCVLLPSGSAEDARAVALDAVRRLDAEGGERISCGVAARTDQASRPAELLRAADEAQYRAKRAGQRVDVVMAGEAPEEPRRRVRTAPTARPNPTPRSSASCSTCSTTPTGHRRRSGWPACAPGSNAKPDLEGPQAHRTACSERRRRARRRAQRWRRVALARPGTAI